MLDILGKSTFDEAYEEYCLNPDVDNSKESFLADAYFRIVTYDDELTLYYGKLIREIILAIDERRNYEYMGIECEEDYRNFILVANLLHGKGLIEWGSSIRGCWFNSDAKELIEFCRT